MNIYGEKCHRCGQKTRRNRKSKPTCGHCIAVIDSKHEEIRNCPVDNNKMNKEIIKNIILDRCPLCSGIWFDKDEIETFEELINKVSNELIIHKIIKGIAQGKYEE
jgi:hypothetical protein